MFTPRELALERGWPGRIEGERVVQLAAQTLQAFFTGGGGARDHAEYPLGEIELRAPVLHPPSLRIYRDGELAFGNAASIVGPGEQVPFPGASLRAEPALAAVIGGAGAVAGFTVLNDWTAPGLGPVKERDFATSLGPVVVTTDELDGMHALFSVRRNGEVVAETSLHPGDWDALVEHAGRNTRLLPGDVIAVAGPEPVPVQRGDVVELEVPGIGVLENPVAG